MKKILIVDDQSEVRELLKVTLEVEPYEVFEAERGQQALEIARQDHPDLILLDVMLQEPPNGLEVCRILKNDEATSNIPVVMLTARGQETDEEAGYDAGADDYLVKPFSPLALIKKLEAILVT